MRGEQGVAVSWQGRLLLVGGYAYSEDGYPQVRYNDVWQSDFNIEDTQELAARCGGPAAIPTAGVGLMRWPGDPVVPANTLTFSPLTRRAPWSPRIQPALLLMNKPLSYINPNDGSTSTTGPNWLLMYEGSLTASANPEGNENDVYASADDGRTWTLISGIARLGGLGLRYSAYPFSSFRATSGAGNCEDPTSDDVYASGGIQYFANGTTMMSREVWHSSDAIHWTLRTGAMFSPGRYFHSCDVDNSGRLYIIGGRAAGPPATSFLNDVWTSTTKGQSWTLLSAAAPFPGRYEHALQIVHSPYYRADLIYVVGGYVWTGALDTANDVWVSRDSALTWLLLTAAAPWAKRWGHGMAITENGAVVVLGGTSSGTPTSYNDMWASLNGGVTWTMCRTEVNQTIIRGEQGHALTASEHLVVGNGYRYQGLYRVEYSDLYISDVSLGDPAVLARTCATTVPAAGVGLRVAAWQPAAMSSSSARSSSSSSSVSSSISSSARVSSSTSSPSSSARISSSSSSSSSASSSAIRRVSSSSSSSSAVKAKPCPYWAWGSLQPKCSCPDESPDGTYPVCYCPARYGPDAMIPWDCPDLFPDPDDPMPIPATDSSSGSSSSGLGGATIAAIVLISVAVAVVAAFVYFRSRAQQASGAGDGGGGGGGGGLLQQQQNSSLVGLLRDTDSISASQMYGAAVAEAPQQPTGLDYYLAPATQTQPGVQSHAVEVPAL